MNSLQTPTIAQAPCISDGNEGVDKRTSHVRRHETCKGHAAASGARWTPLPDQNHPTKPMGQAGTKLQEAAPAVTRRAHPAGHRSTLCTWEHSHLNIRGCQGFKVNHLERSHIGGHVSLSALARGGGKAAHPRRHQGTSRIVLVGMRSGAIVRMTTQAGCQA